MINTKPILGDMRLNVTDNLGKYEVYNGETWVIMENYDTIESLRAQNSKLQTDLDIALSYIKQYELQIKQFKDDNKVNFELTDEKIDECSCFVNVELSQRYGSIESIDDIDWTITGLRAFARAILRKAQE